MRWYRLLAIFSPLMVVLVVELCLRVFGCGFPTSFFLSAKQEGKPVLIENYQFGWRFFPSTLARSPQPILFPTVKPPGGLRVFVFGESAAMGDPEPSYGLARQLERLLQAAHPERAIQVVNVAMTAINSHVIRDIARDCAGAEGDCWIIYAGNNEVVGPYGAGTVFGRQAASLAFIRLDLALKRFRLVQALGNMGGNRQATEWRGMEMFREHEVTSHDPKLRRVYDNFERNMRAIIDAGARCGAKVVVASVPVNLKDCPPFASKHRAGLTADQEREWTARYEAGRKAEGQGRFAEALSAYEQAAQFDAEHAELNYRRASCQRALGQTNAAKASYALARDLDTLRFRADSRLNEIVRRSARSKSAAFVDAEEECSRAAPGQVPGDEVFHDHVHLNFSGNYWLATLLLPEVERQLFGQTADANPALRLSESDMARRLAFTDFDRGRVAEEMRARLRQPPFSEQSNYAERDGGLTRQLAVLTNSPTSSLTNYVDAIRLATNDWCCVRT